MKIEAAHAETFTSGGSFAVLADRIELFVFDDGILRVGDFAIVFEEVTSAGAVNGFRRADIQEVLDEVEGMLAEVGHLAAGIIPEPAEVIDGAIWVVRLLRRGTEEHFVIHTGGWRAIRRLSEAGRDVSHEGVLDGNDV